MFTHRRRILLAIGAVVVSGFARYLNNTISSILAVLDVGDGRLIILNRVFDAEGYPKRKIEFDARENPLSCIGQCTVFFVKPSLSEIDKLESASHKYDTVFAENKNIVGVIDKALDPNQPVLMCDFESRKCFPCGITDEERNNIFEILKRENPLLHPHVVWRNGCVKIQTLSLKMQSVSPAA